MGWRLSSHNARQRCWKWDTINATGAINSCPNPDQEGQSLSKLRLGFLGSFFFLGLRLDLATASGTALF